MAIADEKLKHGYVISQIVLELSKFLDTTVRVTEGVTRSGYELVVYNRGRMAGKFGLVVKFSTKRASPWRYSFTLDHQAEIDILYEECGEVFVALVNKDDGVVCLSHQLLRQVLDDTTGKVKWISVKSRLGSRYDVSGSNGNLGKKVSRSDFARSVTIHAASLIHALEPSKCSSGYKKIWDRILGQ